MTPRSKTARGILVELEMGRDEVRGEKRNEREGRVSKAQSGLLWPLGLWGIRGRGALFSGWPFGGDGLERRGTVGSFEVGRYRV